MSRVSHAIDCVRVSFDDPNRVANAGLLLVGTLVVRLELERLVNATVALPGRGGGARPGRKVLTLVHAMVAGASHIDHADGRVNGFLHLAALRSALEAHVNGAVAPECDDGEVAA